MSRSVVAEVVNAKTNTYTSSYSSVYGANGRRGVAYVEKYVAIPQDRDQQDGMGSTGAISVTHSGRLGCLRTGLVSDNAEQ